jgi:hypothetical protein
VCEGTTLNCCLYRALRDAAELARVLGETQDATRYAEAAAALRRAINEHLWDEASGAYHGAIRDGVKTPPTAHAATIALYDDVVPTERLQRVRAFLLASYAKEGFFPYTHRFLLEVLYEMDADAADQLALELVRKRWTDMAAYETQTTWEGFRPGENCHESGASPTYFLSAYVLGVRVQGSSADRRLLIQPRLADLTDASGIVVTELGPVPIAWRRNKAETGITCRLAIPERVQAVVDLPRMSDNIAVIVDGRGLAQRDIGVEAGGKQRHRFVRIELGAGKHEIQVVPR